MNITCNSVMNIRKNYWDYKNR